MPCTTYYSESQLQVLAPKDKELNELLEEVNARNSHKFYITERERVKTRWFRKPIVTKSYELLVDLKYGEYQVINFAQEWDWSINLEVSKSYIVTYLLGFLGGLGNSDRN